jgi:hypothetical protein
MTADIALVVVYNYGHAEAMAGFMEAIKKKINKTLKICRPIS